MENPHSSKEDKNETSPEKDGGAKKKEKNEDDEKPSSSNQYSEDIPQTMQEVETRDDESAIETIRRYMAEKLGFSEGKKSEDSKKKTVFQVLDEVTVAGVVKFIKSGQCQRIIVMAGAGISTSAGIPDFRSPGSGLYDNLAKYKLPHPQAIFEIDFFKENPLPFFCLAKELFPGSYKPTLAHYFVRLLHEKNLLLRHYTQNIDGLEKVAGVPAEKVVEAHGTFYTSHCLSCWKEYNLEWMKERIFADTVPKCEDCQGLIKPDIVFFGENLPERFFSLAKEDFSKADLLIIMGSSLAVQPFASLVDRVSPTCPRLLLNRVKAGQRDKLMALLGMGGGLDLDSDKNYRDVAFLGDCDDLCQQLVDQLGWTEDFEKLISLRPVVNVLREKSFDYLMRKSGRGAAPLGYLL